MGENNENDRTQGCIRGQNSDIEKLADMVDEVHKTEGRAVLTVSMEQK